MPEPVKNTKKEASAYEQYVNALKAKRIDDPSQAMEGLLARVPEMTSPIVFEQIDKLKGWLDSFRPFPASVVRELKRLYDVRFTYHTNAIEGNTLTQSETEMVLEKGLTVGGKTLKEHLEVIGHKEAIDYMEALAQGGEATGEREIRDLHNLILRGIDREQAGRYRTIDVKAAGTEHLYPPNYRLAELMEAFAAWLSSEAAKGRHPVEYASEAHYRFVSIHPFQDGNGRTARLLMNLLLVQEGYPVVVITNERRKEYIDALAQGQTQGDDTGPLTALVAEATRSSLIDYLRVLSTAYENRGRGLPFYQEMTAYLKGQA